MYRRRNPVAPSDCPRHDFQRPDALSETQCVNCGLLERKYLKDENELLRSAMCSPEVYVGVITENMERELCDLHNQLKKYRKDAARYQFLKKHSIIELGSYESESGWMKEATRSFWHFNTHAVLESTNKAPDDVDKAIDAAIEEAVRRGGYRSRPVASAPN
jgi:hypothetical protein